MSFTRFAVFFSLLFLSSLTACVQNNDPLRIDDQDIVWTYTDTLSITHWNLGHLSLGKSNCTAINASEIDSFASSYHSLLDSMDVDFYGICEYEPYFSKEGGSTRQILFEAFPYFFEGNKSGYNCNALFSDIPLYHSMTGSYSQATQERYFVESTVKINGQDVKIVETHLDWDEGENGARSRESQIKQLIEAYSQKPYVIIAGDFNVSDAKKEYDPFITAGFQLANDGSLCTYPADKPTVAIDNILFRGFSLDSIKVISAPHLSDHCLLYCKLVFQYGSK